MLYFAKGVAAAGLSIKVIIVTGLATPVICQTVWSVVRRIRNRIMHQAGATAEGEAAP